ncbi:MAG: MBL fold metallo-hydrolase [Myxococcota bacterium]
MEVEFLGAAQTVTGSMHLVHTPAATVLLECGLFQGRRGESAERNRTLPVRPKEIDVVVLSHAHIDHCGALPRLYKLGYRGPIYATPATRDLCSVMLADAARIQESDARYINKTIERDKLDLDPVEPLYDQDDVIGVLSLMRAIPYRARTPIAAGVDVTFLDAGHVLGSAEVLLDVDDVGQEKRLVFTGDLGRRNMPILRDPEVPSDGCFLISESTYGDRLHDPIERMDDALQEIVTRTYERKGKVIVPSFALERAQEIIFALKGLRSAGRIPDDMPVYVDSPLAVAVTDVFRLHPDCYDKATRTLLRDEKSPFDFPGLTYTQSVEDSKAITGSSEPAIVISASGMCEFGRVLHHLKASIGDKNDTVLIVGWQAQHTLGRRLVEKRTRVKIFGVEQERRCEVRVLNGFSAHADQSDLVAFAEDVRNRGPLRQVALVHGEPGPQETLKGLLEGRGFPKVHIPAQGDRIQL